MTPLAAAEFVLSLVMPQDRAAAAAGDFVEGGSLSLATILWTTISSAGRQWLDAPARLLFGAALLWFGFLAATIVLAFKGFLLWAVLYLADNHTGLELLTTRWGTRVPLAPPALLSYWLGTLVLPCFTAWRAGSNNAKRAPGRDLATWTAVAFVWTVLGSEAKLPAATLIVGPAMFVAGGVRTRYLGVR